MIPPSDMTEFERQIWAATYGAAFLKYDTKTYSDARWSVGFADQAVLEYRRLQREQVERETPAPKPPVPERRECGDLCYEGGYGNHSCTLEPGHRGEHSDGRGRWGS